MTMTVNVLTLTSLSLKLCEFFNDLVESEAEFSTVFYTY